MNPEQARYEALWSQQNYRLTAPGERYVPLFIRVAEITAEHTVADFGCGTGRPAASIRQFAGAKVKMFDFAENCLDEFVKTNLSADFAFQQHDLLKPFNEHFDFGFCTDVLEHIAPENVNTVLMNMGNAANVLFLAISTVPDQMSIDGKPLHLTIRDASWWLETVQGLGFTVIGWRSSPDSVRMRVTLNPV